MEFQKDTVTYSKPAFHDTVLTDAGGDVIIPDTAPDVGALLWVGGNICLEEKAVKDGSLTLRGHVDFTALYRPENNDVSLSSVSYTFPFSHTQEIPEINPGSFVSVHASPSRISGVMQNSRKLTVYAKVALGILCENQESGEALSPLPEETGVEYKSVNITSMCPQVITASEVRAEGEVELPTGSPGILRVQNIFVLVTNEECQSIANKLIWKSTLALTLLYTDPDGNLSTAESEFPVTEILDASGLTEDMICCTVSSVDGVAYRTQSERNLEIAVTLTVSTTAYEENSFPAIIDAYCPRKALSCEEDALLLSRPPVIKEESFTRKETVILDESEPPIGRVLFAHAIPVAEDVHTEAGTAEVDLRLILSLLYLSAEETPHLCSVNREIRVSEEIADLKITENMKGFTFASLQHISFCLLGAEEVECRLVLSLRLFLSSVTSISFLTGADISDLPPSDRPAVVISFAHEGDTLWKIAKRYNVPMEDLLSANDISSDLAVTDGMQFLIPR